MQCTVGAASWEVSRCLPNWLGNIQHDIDAGVPRDDILDAFKKGTLTADFLADSAYQQVRLSSRAMALFTAGRWSLWLKPWKADVAFKFSLCGLPFKPGRLFGFKLDGLMEGLSDRGYLYLKPQETKKRVFRRTRSPSRYRSFRGQRGRPRGNERWSSALKWVFEG